MLGPVFTDGVTRAVVVGVGEGVAVGRTVVGAADDGVGVTRTVSGKQAEAAKVNTKSAPSKRERCFICTH
jgi:hypothetical protein